MTLRNNTQTYFFKLALLAAVYAGVIYLSLFLLPGGTRASIVWPPSALGLGALLILGLDYWPALLVPSFFVLLLQGILPPVAASIAAANTLEAVAGALLLRRFNFSLMLWRLQDGLLLILASVVVPIVSATIVALSVSALQGGPFSNQLWLEIWIGHMVSLLSFGPFVIRWGYKPLFKRTRAEWIEGAACFGSFFIINVFAYWTPYASVGSISLLYISIIPLIWAALRTGPRGIALALFILTSVSITGIEFGHGVFVRTNLEQVLFGIQLVIGTLSTIFLLFSSIVEERKEAVIALRSHVGQLETALEAIRTEDQAKADFIAILAHELRNPLSPLLSGIELLKLREQGAPEILGMMGAHLHTMGRLLDDLLDISRISQKKFKIQKQPVKLGDIVAQALEMVDPYLVEYRHTLTTTLPEGEVWIDGDPVRLVQIFSNLLTNAAKYTPQGGTIRLSAERRGGEIVVLVSDTGIGIEPKRLAQIFEPFGVGDAGRGVQGLHIGLSLAKRMAELHQGALEAHSEGPGRGSTFVAKLPLMTTAPLPLELGAPKRSRFSPAESGKSRALGALEILIVDDNEAAAESLARLLEHNGHKTLIAHDAQEALKLTHERAPRAALLDIGLPGMDGYELCRKMRERWGDDLLIIALTGYGQAEDKQKARDAGFDKHLIKPVSIVDIERALVDLGA